MLRTLSAAAFLALMVPTIGSADDADSEKQVASLSKQFREADGQGRHQGHGRHPGRRLGGHRAGRRCRQQGSEREELKDGTIDFEAMDPSEVKVRVYGDAAVVTSRVHVKLKIKGEKVDNHVRVSEFYVKQGGKWRCVSTQVTSIAEPSREKR